MRWIMPRLGPMQGLNGTWGVQPSWYVDEYDNIRDAASGQRLLTARPPGATDRTLLGTVQSLLAEARNAVIGGNKGLFNDLLNKARARAASIANVKVRNNAFSLVQRAGADPGLGQEEDWTVADDVASDSQAIYGQVQKFIARAKEAQSGGATATANQFIGQASQTAMTIQDADLRNQAFHDIQTLTVSDQATASKAFYTKGEAMPLLDLAKDFAGNVEDEAVKRARQAGDVAKKIASVPWWAWVAGAAVVLYAAVRR